MSGTGRTRGLGSSGSRARRCSSPPRASAAALLASVPLGLGIATAAPAADHSDGPIGLDVIAGLAEGPPYPAEPVRIAASLRQGPGSPTPAGELHLTLADARDEATGAPIPLQGTAFDNGDPFGEPGDSVSMDVYFVPGAPDDEPPVASLMLWHHRPEPTGPSAPSLTYTNAEPMTLEFELFFQDYEVEAQDGAGTVLATTRMRTRFEIAPGQDLRFEDVSASGPDAAGELSYSGSLRRIAGGSFDPGRPLYTVTISSEPLRRLPALPATGLAISAGVLLLAGAVCAARSGAPAQQE